MEPTPVQIKVDCSCGWKATADECPMCAMAEHEKATGHKVNFRMVEVPNGTQG